MKKIYIILLCIFVLNTDAKENKQSAFAFNYNFQIPRGSLTNTFGNNSAIGVVFFLERKNNILFGIESNYMFGDNIKNPNIFDNISTANGGVISANGQYGNINIMQRGINCYLFAGYAFHLLPKNLSGVYISQGVGYLQHQIFIDTKNQNIPQLNEEMKKGYDQLTSGFSTKFSIDYKYYHKKGRFQIS